MKKKSIYIITSLLFLFFCICLNTVHAQIEQNLKYVDITQETVSNAITISDELTKHTMSNGQIYPFSLCSTGNVFIEDNHLNFMNNLTIDRIEELHQSAKTVWTPYISNNGNSIVYSIDNYEKISYSALYERKKNTNENSYSDPIQLYQHKFVDEYLYLLGNSNDGDVIIWLESVPKTDMKLMILDRTPSGIGTPQVLSVSRGLQFGGGVSANKNFIYFTSFWPSKGVETYFTYKDEKGQWILPKNVLINGTIANIDAINYDGSLVAIRKQIYYREKDQFTLIRGFDFDYETHWDYQMTNDGKTLYMVASKEPLRSPDISEPPPVMYDLLKITWTDDNHKPSMQVLDSANEISYRMLYDGGRVIWNTKMTTSVDVDQWGKMDQKN